MSLGASSAAKKGPSLADSIIQKVQAQLANTGKKIAGKAGEKGKADNKAVSAHKGESGFDCKCAKAGDKKAAAKDEAKHAEKGAKAGHPQAAPKDGKAPAKKELGKG